MWYNNFIVNQRETPAIISDLLVNRPVRAGKGAVFISTDTLAIYRYNGAEWDEISNTIYANIIDYGAVGDGVTDNLQAFLDALNSGLPVLIPNGEFFISSTINLISNKSIIGVGNGSIVYLGSGNYPAFTIAGNDIKIYNLTVKGLGRGTVTNYATMRPLQHGVYLLGQTNTALARSNVKIDNCFFDTLGGSGVFISTNIVVGWVAAVSVTNSTAKNCFSGFTTANRAEYNTFVNNSASFCQYGIWNQGGNNSFVGGHLTSNMTGFFLRIGENDAHSTATNVTINHNTDLGISVDRILTGWVFDGCNIWANNILVIASNGVHFSDCQFGSVAQINYSNSTKCTFSNSRWFTTPTFNLSHLSLVSDVKFFGNIWEAAPAPNIFNSIQNELVLPITVNKVLRTDTLNRISDGSITDDGNLVTIGNFARINNNVGIGTSSITGTSINVAKNINGSASSYGIYQDGQIQSDVTNIAVYNQTVARAISAAFTLPNLYHFSAAGGTTFGAATVTNQVGFDASSSLTGGVNNIGFRGRILFGPNRWNILITGDANSSINGRTLFGTISDDGVTRVQVNGGISANNIVRFPKIVGNSIIPTILMAGNFTTGIGATASIIGNDIAGEITFTTTTGISTSGTIFTFTYSSPYSSAPIILFAPASQTLTTGANPIISRLFVSSTDIGQFQISVSAGTLLTESTTFKLNYHILGK